MISATSLPDRPVAKLDDDLLSRAEFAKSLAALIIDAPAGSSLRIGVYGGWGEGKTSVLQMVREVIAPRGHVCVWLVPWAADSATEIATHLTREIAASLRIDLSDLESNRRRKRLLAKARELAGVDTRVKAAEIVFAPALERILGKQYEEQTAALIARIHERLNGRKLVVFVDDLDRVRPDLVPNLLLTLREALDQPGYFYVLALAPDVVERALTAVHEAWGERGHFLEKIVELPRQLPPLSEHARRNYVEHLVSLAAGFADAKALRDVAQYLPANPRRIKLLIRYLMSLHGLLSRFDDHDIDRRTLYIAQLIRIEFPSEVQAMLSDASLLKDMQYSFIIDKSAFLARTYGEEAERKRNRPEHAYAPKEDPGRSRFITLCEALREHSGGTWGRYGAPFLLSFPDSIPRRTRREMRDLADRWLDASSAQVRQKLLIDALKDLAEGGREGVHLLWNGFLEVRNDHLGSVIERDLGSELEEGLKIAESLVGLLDAFGRGAFGFHVGMLGWEQWKELFQHVGRWAHFKGVEAHLRVRRSEWDLVRNMFELLQRLDQAQLYPFLRRFRADEPTPAPGSLDLVQQLRFNSARAAVRSTLDRFEAGGGLQVMWSDGGDAIGRSILFDPKSPLYTEAEYFAQLLGVAERAGHDTEIQRNFLIFFRQLAYGASEGGSFSVRDCRTLLANGELLRAVWMAAVVQPLNPRVAGSLRANRTEIATHIADESAMPLPEWWNRLAETGFFRDEPATSERPRTEVEAEP